MRGFASSTSSDLSRGKIIVNSNLTFACSLPDFKIISNVCLLQSPANGGVNDISQRAESQEACQSLRDPSPPSISDPSSLQSQVQSQPTSVCDAGMQITPSSPTAENDTLDSAHMATAADTADTATEAAGEIPTSLPVQPLDLIRRFEADAAELVSSDVPEAHFIPQETCGRTVTSGFHAQRAASPSFAQGHARFISFLSPNNDTSPCPTATSADSSPATQIEAKGDLAQEGNAAAAIDVDGPESPEQEPPRLAQALSDDIMADKANSVLASNAEGTAGQELPEATVSESESAAVADVETPSPEVSRPGAKKTFGGAPAHDEDDDPFVKAVVDFHGEHAHAVGRSGLEGQARRRLDPVNEGSAEKDDELTGTAAVHAGKPGSTDGDLLLESYR